MQGIFCMVRSSTCRDPGQTGCVPFDVIEFGDLGGGVAQEVRHLSGREGFDGAVGLFYAVDQVGCEGVPEAVESFLLDPHRFKDAVVAFAEVHRLGVAALLVWNQRAIFSEVSLRSQLQNGIDRRLI